MTESLTVAAEENREEDKILEATSTEVLAQPLDKEELLGVALEKIEGLQQQLARPSERIAREAMMFVQDTRPLIAEEYRKAAVRLNDQLNTAADRRMNKLNKLAKRVARTAASAAIEETTKLKGIFKEGETRAVMLDAIREVAREIMPPEAAKAIGDMPEPVRVSEDPHYSPTIVPALEEFLSQWRTHGPRTAILTGPTGCGKTHPVKQWALRNGVPLYMIQGGEGCATRREAVGGYVLGVKDGASTMEKQIGIASAAARLGATLLFDEYDKVDPFVIGQLNDLFDQGGLLMPWGEYLVPHENFRVILTCNGLTDDSGAYVAHQTSSELPMRCWGFQCTWPDEASEAAWLNSATGLKADEAERLVRCATALRKEVRPAPSLRTTRFVATALVNGIPWATAWKRCYQYQFKTSSGQKVIDITNGA